MNLADIFTVANTLSWVFYLAVFGAAALFAHLAVTKKRKLYAVVAIAIPTLMSGLRYMVGVDYASYVEKLQLLASRDLLNYATTGIKNVFEPTFYAFSQISFANSDQAILFFTISSVLVLLFYFLAVKKYSPRHAGLMFFLILMTVFPKDLSGVRQGVAVAICFYAVSFVAEKRFWSFLLLILLASLFHYSALIVIAIYPLYWLLYKRWPYIKDRYYLFRVLSLVASGLAAVFVLIANLSKIPFFGRYAYLLSPEKLSSVGTPNVLSKIAPLLIVAPYYKKIVKQDKNSAFYVLLSILATVFTSIGFIAGAIARLANYFIPFYVILFASILDAHSEDKVKQRRMVVFMVIYAVVFFTGSNLVRNSYGIFPYQFIF